MILCFGSAYSDKSGCSIASGSSSIGGNSTTTLSGNEYNSLTISDEISADNLHIDFSTNYGKCIWFISFSLKIWFIVHDVNHRKIRKKKNIYYFFSLEFYIVYNILMTNTCTAFVQFVHFIHFVLKIYVLKKYIQRSMPLNIYLVPNISSVENG